MGRKLDFLLRRNTKTTKLKTLTNLAISRITILKNQRDVRCSHARSDVTQLLNLGQHEHALLRVEHVIKEQSMLEVFAMIENHCNLLTERVMLFENNRECPDELKEPISSLIFAASRCGEFPELQQIREIFTSKFGNKFAARAVELRNNCGVNPKMIQKLSTREASLESRMKVLKQIASENGIVLHLEDYTSMITEEKQDVKQKKNQLEPEEAAKADDPKVIVGAQNLTEEMTRVEEFSESVKSRKKYRDVAAAAQDAFESAAYAAAAARAAVELSRSESWDYDPDDHGGSNNQRRTVFDSDGSSKYKLKIDGDTASEDSKHSEKVLDLEIESFSSESEGEKMAQNNRRGHLKELERRKTKSGIERKLSASSLDSDGNNSSIYDENAPLGTEIVFDGSDNETGMPRRTGREPRRTGRETDTATTQYGHGKY